MRSGPLRRFSCVLLLVVAAFASGCGGGGSKTAVAVNITAPQDGSTTKDVRVTVRGTVSPADAGVEVVGQPAQVANGVFSASVRLKVGDNRIDVVGTKSGADPATTAITITRRSRGASKKPATTNSSGASASNTRSCGDGITANSVTSCPFAIRVRDAYTEQGGPDVDVYSPVTQQTYTMHCSGGSGAQVTCSGGNGASVTF